MDGWMDVSFTVKLALSWDLLSPRPRINLFLHHLHTKNTTKSNTYRISSSSQLRRDQHKSVTAENWGDRNTREMQMEDSESEIYSRNVPVTRDICTNIHSSSSASSCQDGTHTHYPAHSLVKMHGTHSRCRTHVGAHAHVHVSRKKADWVSIWLFMVCPQPCSELVKTVGSMTVSNSITEISHLKGNAEI